MSADGPIIATVEVYFYADGRRSASVSKPDDSPIDLHDRHAVLGLVEDAVAELRATFS